MKVDFAARKPLLQTAFFLFLFLQIQAQPITGIWKGKMGSSKVELKLVRKGDSLIGTSYYYESKSNYRRYSVKGYFDDKTNDVVWWDDVLIEEKNPRRFISGGPTALLAMADFNCPGEGVMKLDGSTTPKDDLEKGKKELHLLKANNAPVFPDEWDFLIDNYAYAVANPGMIDSVEEYAFHPEPIPVQTASGTPILPDSPPAQNPPPAVVSRNDNPVQSVPDESPAKPHPSNTAVENTLPLKKEPLVAGPTFIPPSEQSNEERFSSRRKILQNVIPVKGDSIELRFYDNAEIDGDSIAVFLNGRLLKEHILLAETAYIMKIAVNDLQPDNELVMVAENLGTIPPNTSLMVAIVEDKRYEAHLQSTEGSSALVRLVKP